MNYPQILYKYPQYAGEPFSPSNGTEGMIFYDAFCDKCLHSHPDPDKKPQCEILCYSLIFEIEDPEYPKEWIYNDAGWPVCTSWTKWDWGDEGNWNEPPGPEPYDPDQLLIPFSITDYFDFDCEVVVTKRGIFEFEKI